jgi:hypothetical protein
VILNLKRNIQIYECISEVFDFAPRQLIVYKFNKHVEKRPQVIMPSHFLVLVSVDAPEPCGRAPHQWLLCTDERIQSLAYKPWAIQ